MPELNRWFWAALFALAIAAGMTIAIGVLLWILLRGPFWLPVVPALGALTWLIKMGMDYGVFGERWRKS